MYQAAFNPREVPESGDYREGYRYPGIDSVLLEQGITSASDDVTFPQIIDLALCVAH